MTGNHADWLTDPRTLRFAVAGTFALALMLRVLAGFLVQRLLRVNRKKRNFRYRIPLARVHPRPPQGRGTAGTVPFPRNRGRRTTASVNRSAP